MGRMRSPARAPFPALLCALTTAVALGGTGCGRQETQGLGNLDAFVAVGEDGAAPDADLVPTDGAVPGDGGGPTDAEVAGDLVVTDSDGPFQDAGGPDPDGSEPETDAGSPDDDGGPGPQRDVGTDANMRPDVGPGRDGGPARDGGPVPDAGLCTQNSDCGRGGGFTVFCEPTTGQCLDCFQDNHCRGNQVCDLAIHECRSACFNGRCAPGQVCEPMANICVDCLADTDCNGGDVCNTTTRECVECTSNAQCALVVGRPVCDAASATCVGCASDADCTNGEVCDPQLQACVSAIGSRGLCEACSTDAQCGGNGNLCIGINVGGGNLIDRTCGLDCANASCPSGFECIDVRGGTARQCRPRYAMQNPSCTAISHLGDACPFSATNSDPGCGLSNRQDALCILAPGGTGGVCTIGCAAAADCPTGYTCTGAAPGQTGVCL